MVLLFFKVVSALSVRRLRKSAETYFPRGSIYNTFMDTGPNASPFTNDHNHVA